MPTPPDTVRELRRDQIVTAARQIVSESGLAALTIGALENALSFSRGVITYHFENKDEIITEVFKSAIAEIDATARATVQASLTTREKIGAMLRSHLHGFLEHPAAVTILISMWSRAGFDPTAKRGPAELFATYRRRCEQLLRAEYESGAFAQASFDAIAGLMVSIVIGIAVQAHLGLEPGKLDRVIDEATTSILVRIAPDSK